MTDLDAQVIIDGNRIFTEFKGALTEQYILQQLVAMNCGEPYYFGGDIYSHPVKSSIEYVALSALSPLGDIFE